VGLTILFFLFFFFYSRPDLLNKFNVLVAKYVNLVEEMNKPSFQRIIIHPDEVLPAEVTPEYCNVMNFT
jgi:hypothetical protein